MSPYTKNFIQTQSLPFSLRINRKISLEFFKNPLVLNIIFISLIIFFIVFQLILANKVAVYSFKIKELGEKERVLERENRNLELEKIRLESLKSSEADFKNLNLVKAENLEYLKPVGGAVVKK